MVVVLLRALCVFVVCALDVDADVGAELAAACASTEPGRATPATSREAIASLRIVVLDLEYQYREPGRRLGWRDNLTLRVWMATKPE